MTEPAMLCVYEVNDHEAKSLEGQKFDPEYDICRSRVLWTKPERSNVLCECLRIKTSSELVAKI